MWGCAGGGRGLPTLHTTQHHSLHHTLHHTLHHSWRPPWHCTSPGSLEHQAWSGSCDPWLLVTALFLLASGHSGLGVSQRPCCLAVGHCLVPCDPVSDTGESLVTRVFQHLCFQICVLFAVFAACSTQNTSGQAFVASDASARPWLGVLLMSRKRLSEFGVLLCCFCGGFGHLVWGEGMYACACLQCICGCRCLRRAFRHKN